MKELKHSSDLTITTIKALFQGLKKDRKVLNWAEFADKIGKDRTYMSRIMNGHEPLTDTVRNAIFQTFVNPTKNVVSEPEPPYQAQKSQPLELAGLNVTLEDHINEIKRSRDFLERMLDGGLQELKISLEKHGNKLMAIQSDLIARSEVALDALAKIQNPKKPPELREEADRRSKQRQGLLPHTNNGGEGKDV